MKLFGTVKSFDSAQGHGQITPEAGGDLIRFDKSAIAWDKQTDPTIGQRLSYESGKTNDQVRALNLQTAQSIDLGGAVAPPAFSIANGGRSRAAAERLNEISPLSG